MIREKDGGLFTNSLEDWGKLWVDHNPYWAIEPHRTETTTLDWIAPPMTATEIQRQVKDAIREFDKQKEIETIAGFKIGDRVESVDAYRLGTVTDLRYERKIDDEIYIMEVFWDDGMASKFFLPTNEIIKVKKGEAKMKNSNPTIKKMPIFNGASYKVTFNGPATILFVDGIYSKRKQKFVTKAYNEDFDEEKGLALALLKSFGMSYLDFKRILATAKKEEKKVEERKEEPKAEAKETPNKIRVNGIDFTVGSHAPIYTVEPTRSTEKSKYTVHQNKKKGKSYRFKKGDKCMVRLCKSYDFESVEDVRPLIGKPYGVVYVKNGIVNVNGLNFSPSELDRID